MDSHPFSLSFLLNHSTVFGANWAMETAAFQISNLFISISIAFDFILLTVTTFHIHTVRECSVSSFVMAQEFRRMDVNRLNLFHGTLLSAHHRLDY
jgi:hypothetical protein